MKTVGDDQFLTITYEKNPLVNNIHLPARILAPPLDLAE